MPAHCLSRSVYTFAFQIGAFLYTRVAFRHAHVDKLRAPRPVFKGAARPLGTARKDEFSQYGHRHGIRFPAVYDPAALHHAHQDGQEPGGGLRRPRRERRYHIFQNNVAAFGARHRQRGDDGVSPVHELLRNHRYFRQRKNSAYRQADRIDVRHGGELEHGLGARHRHAAHHVYHHARFGRLQGR